MAVGYFVCGGPVGGSGSSLSIPITADVARTDPTLGASIVLIYAQFAYLNPSTVDSIIDDADVDDDYSLCLFADGLNHYDTIHFPHFGLVVNPLLSGVHNITIALPAPVDWVQAVAIAVTGVGDYALGPGWPGNPLDPACAWIVDTVLTNSEQPIGAPTSFSNGPAWLQDTFGALTFAGPAGATDTNWDWQDGEVAFYSVQQVGSNDDPIHWGWTDGAMTEVVGWSIETIPSRFQAFALASSPIVPSLAGPSVAGVWDNGTFPLLASAGGGIGFVAGAGPAPCVIPPPPPPLFGPPVFSSRFRAA